jgi:hypothetical protein
VAGQTPSSLSRWRVPNLIYLEVMGSFTRSAIAELDFFLAHVGVRLRCLVLNINHGSGTWVPWRGHREIWDSFPNLSIFGVSLDWFVSWDRIPDALHALKEISLTVFLPDMRCLLQHDDIQQVTSNLIRWCWLHRCAIDKIAMNESWISMEKYSADVSQDEVASLSGGMWRPPEDAVKALFRVINCSGLPFCDREMVYLDSEAASWFRNGLRSVFPFGR